MSIKEITRAVVRMNKLFKHYKANILTQPDMSDKDAVDQLLVDLHMFCREKGIDLVDRMNEADRATSLPEPKPEERRAVPRDNFGLPTN